MKKIFISAAIAASSLLFISCLEEEAVPVPLPPPPPAIAETVDLPPPPDTLAESPATPDTAIAPPTPVAESTPVPAASTVKELPPPPPFQAFSEVGQLSSGRYTIQIGVYPTEKAAKNVINKLAENKISAYYAHVSNPAHLEGSYYRVRVGYFTGKSVAEEFARTRLTPLNYKWWVDMTRNDAVGTPNTYTPAQSSKEADKSTATPAPATSKSSSQEEDAKKAALEAAKADYKAFAEKADKESKVKAPPPPPVPKIEEKAASKSVEVKGGQVKIK